MKSSMSYWSGYKDELITTGVVFCVAASGSFYMLLSNGLLPMQKLVDNPQEQVLGEVDTSTPSDQLQAENQVLSNDTQAVALMATPSPTPSLSTLTTFTPEVETTPQPTPITAYINGGRTFDYPKYRLAMAGLRMINDQQTKTRTFKLDVILANKSATEGLHNKLSVSIIKDGKVIIESTPLSVSESKTVMPGQQLTYTASISLIEGTDVKEIYYKPGISLLEEIVFTVIP